MTVEIKKTRKSEVSFGDRGAQFHEPARYGVYVDDKEVGYIHGSTTGFMTGTEWDINEWDATGQARPVMFFNMTSQRTGLTAFKQAKAFAIEYFGGNNA
jgi:hypothetical protein